MRLEYLVLLSKELHFFETLFDVDVLKVNIINVPAKRTRRIRSRRVLVRRTGYKKAIVTLAPDDTIDIFEGVK